MLNRNTFEDGLRALVYEYEGKGFKMPKERADRWYENMKDMPDEEYTQRINKILRGEGYAPNMADILNISIDKPFISEI